MKSTDGALSLTTHFAHHDARTTIDERRLTLCWWWCSGYCSSSSYLFMYNLISEGYQVVGLQVIGQHS